MYCGHRKSKVKRCIALTDADDGASLFWNGLDIGPNLERGLKLLMHCAGDRVALENPGVCLAIEAGIVREITAGPQHNLNRLRNPRAGEDFRNHVEPGGPGTGENGQLAVEAPLCHQPFRDGGGTLKKTSNCTFIVEDALVEFDSVQHNRAIRS